MSDKKQPPMVTKLCKVCSAEFLVSKYRVNYKHTCSHACRVKASALGHATGVTIVKRECPTCGAGFSLVKGQEKNKRYCSSKCGHVARAKVLTTAEETTCSECGKLFSRAASKRRQTTCSIYCGNEKQKKTWAAGVGLGAPEAAAHAAMHRAKKMNAVPIWCNAEEVLAVYREADRLRREHGSNVHVDHIVPLTSELVAGLHWEGNLQILDGFKNQAKGNKTWPDMP